MKKPALKSCMAAALALLGLAAGARRSEAATLNGAGASFPYPIYSKWFDAYGKANAGVRINYQSIGSGGGIQQITRKVVDFGATDGPMTDQQMFKVDGKILHVPTVLGAVVPVFNLGKQVQDLNLDGEVLAGIFLGKIRQWDDDAIQALNPGVKLPGNPITVIHRADGSGTSYCFTDYLSKVSKEWAGKVGRGTAVRWPVGLGGKGNEGVAGLVAQTPNSIGYAELIYAQQNGLAYAAVRNKAGKFVKGSAASVTAAAAGTAERMPKDFRISITDPSGAEAYPISTYTWLLVYEKNPSDKGKIIAGFLRWMLEDGQRLAPDLGYAPLPESVKGMVAVAIETIR